MVHVTTDLRQEFDRQVDRGLWQRGRLPQVEAEIDDRDRVEQVVCIAEWSLEELWLARYAADGAMPPEQTGTFAEPRQRVTANRPIIRRLHAI